MIVLILCIIIVIALGWIDYKLSKQEDKKYDEFLEKMRSKYDHHK